jgi:hypothetical protein
MIGRKDDDDTDGATPWPFIGALAVILLVVIGIGLMSLLNRGSDDQREAVVRAALGQNDALQRLDYGAYRANTCAQLAGTEVDTVARQHSSVAAKGPRYVDNVTGVSVDGDNATAQVSYYFDKSKDDKIGVATTFVREDGTWRVCTAGP